MLGRTVTAIRTNGIASPAIRQPADRIDSRSYGRFSRELSSQSPASIDLQRSRHERLSQLADTLSALRTHVEDAFVRIDTEAQRLKIMKVMGTRPLHLAGRIEAPLWYPLLQPLPRANETRNTPPAGALFVLALVLRSIGHCTCHFIVLYFIIFAAFRSVLAPPRGANSPPLFTYRNNRRLNGI